MSSSPIFCWLFLPFSVKAVRKTWPRIILLRAMVGPECQGLPGREETRVLCVCARVRVHGEGKDTDHVVLSRNLAFSPDFSVPYASIPLVTKSGLFHLLFPCSSSPCLHPPSATPDLHHTHQQQPPCQLLSLFCSPWWSGAQGTRVLELRTCHALHWLSLCFAPRRATGSPG